MAAAFRFLGLVAIPLTNWPGTIGLTLAVIAYLLSRLGQRPSVSWFRFVVACAGGYLIGCPWIPPSTILSVVRNAQQSDAPASPLMPGILVLAVLGLLHLLFERLDIDRWLRFFVYFAWLSGAAALGYLWFGVRLLPQPWRFQIEFEMAIAGVLGYCAIRALQLVRRATARQWIMGTLALIGGIQIQTYAAFAQERIGPVDVTKTIEYRMAKAFEQRYHDDRVFAPGNVSLWLDVFTQIPQVAGCCDQSVPTIEHRIAPYVIYSGQNAGSRDADISLLWLKAYGASAIGVTGKNSTEPFKPFANPEKFAGVLPVVWREGDNAIYQLTEPSCSLAHVIRAKDVVRRPPVNGLDVEPLEPYVRALDDPSLPAAEMTWLDARHIRIHANLSQDELLSVQETYGQDWSATVNGQTRPVSTDALGMMVITPRCTGSCTIDLLYDRRTEREEARWGACVGVLILLASVLFLRLRVSSC